MKNSSFLKRLVAFSVLLAFLLNMLMPGSAFSQEITTPSNLILPSVAFQPTTLKGIIIDTQNPFRMEFIVDPGDFNGSHNNANPISKNDTSLPLFSEEEQDIKKISTRLIKYFLAALTMPEEDMWVNLSPYEKDRIVDEAFGETTMGRDLLAQDFILKQLAASLLHPDTKTGKEFWQKIYSQAYEQFGTTDIPFDTFNKVWISPDSAHVYTNGNKAYILSCRMKVQLEEDFLAMTKIKGQQQDAQTPFKDASEILASDIHKKIMREIIIPVIEKEVNEGENFAQLRQIYHSLILSAWFKRKMQKTLLAQAYANQRKIDGLHYVDDQFYDEDFAFQFQEINGLTLNLETPEEIWSSYVETFKKGVYNFVREEQDLLGESTLMPRKYFSGGVVASTQQIDDAMRFNSNPDSIPSKSREILVDASMETVADADPEEYDLPDDPNYDRSLRELRLFLEKLPLLEKLSALDLVAGTGALTQELMRVGFQVTALDYNANMLKNLMRYLPLDERKKVTPLQGDMLNIKQGLSTIEQKDFFSIITIGYALHTFSQEEKEWILQQAFELLDRDGHLVILLRPIDERSVTSSERKRVPNDYVHMLEQAGFQNIQINYPAPWNVMITAQAKPDAAQTDSASTEKAFAINDSRWLKRGRPNQERIEIFKNILELPSLKPEDSLVLANTFSRMTPEMGQQLIEWEILKQEEVDAILIQDIHYLETALQKHTVRIIQALATLTHNYNVYFQKKNIPLTTKREKILLNRLMPTEEIDRIINLGVPEYIFFEILDSKPSLLLYPEKAIDFVERHREKMNGDAFAWRFLLMTDFLSAEREFLIAQELVEKHAELFQNSKRSNDSGKNAAWRFIADNGLNAFKKFVSKETTQPVSDAAAKLTSPSQSLRDKITSITPIARDPQLGRIIRTSDLKKILNNQEARILINKVQEQSAYGLDFDRQWKTIDGSTLEVFLLFDRNKNIVGRTDVLFNPAHHSAQINNVWNYSSVKGRGKFLMMSILWQVKQYGFKIAEWTSSTMAIDFYHHILIPKVSYSTQNRGQNFTAYLDTLQNPKAKNQDANLLLQREYFERTQKRKKEALIAIHRMRTQSGIYRIISNSNQKGEALISTIPGHDWKFSSFQGKYDQFYFSAISQQAIEKRLLLEAVYEDNISVQRKTPDGSWEDVLSSDSIGPKKRDSAEKSIAKQDELGGIDMNPQALHIQEQIGPVSPEEIISTTAISQDSFHIQGLVPVILNMYPIEDMQKLLQ